MNTTQTAINAGLAGVAGTIARPDVVAVEQAAALAVVLVALGLVGAVGSLIGDVRPVADNSTHEQT